MKNKIFATLLALTLALSLTACGSKSDDFAADTPTTPRPSSPPKPQETVTLNVAASPTPHAEILKAVRTHSGRAGHRPAGPRVQRLCGAQHRCGGRRRGRQLLPARPLSG